jgi:hypothetical protein
VDDFEDVRRARRRGAIRASVDELMDDGQREMMMVSQAGGFVPARRISAG